VPPFADQLARLRVAAATGKLPADLGAWVLAELAARADAAERRQLRDRLLVEAARALLPDGSTWARAVAVQRELTALDRRAGDLDAAQQLVAAAVEVDPATPRGVRQLFTILQSRPSRLQTVSVDGESR
jgi:hypothetical protein